eukprot:4619315-Prorocentrum_lima.AAC.1
MQMLHWDHEPLVRDEWSTGVPGAPIQYITAQKARVEYFVHSLTGHRVVQPPFQQRYILNTGMPG